MFCSWTKKPPCVKPIHGTIFETLHSFTAASHSAAGKQRSQGEKSAPMKTACKAKQLMKTKQPRKNEDPNTLNQMRTRKWQHHLLGDRCEYAVQNAFLRLLFVSLLEFKAVVCCASPDRGTDRMLSLML